ncbi:MAG: transcription-repair coupling factor [Planctomycetaceae bacterium]|nr:transcription-repair coupling factor [Planctomycetaceae bacterium]
MSDAERAATASGRLMELAGCLGSEAGFGEVVDCLREGHAATLDGVWGSSCALAAAALADAVPTTLLVVVPTIDQVDELIDDLAMFTRRKPERFPASESFDPTAVDELVGQRLRVLKQLQAPVAPTLLVASIQSLLQPTPSRASLDQHTQTLRVGQSMAVHDLTAWLVRGGLVNTPAVDLPGEFSIRGGIVDVFAQDWENPVRVEFFGDQIESLRRFEISTQRSLESLTEVDLTILGAMDEDRACLIDHLPGQSWILLLEPMELEQQGRQYLERMHEKVQSEEWSVENGNGNSSSLPSPASCLSAPLFTVSEVLKRAFHFSSVTASALAVGSLETTCRLKVESVEQFSGDINRVRSELDEAGAGQEIFVLCQTEAEARRLGDLFSETDAARQGRLRFPVGSLSHGFRLVSERIVLLSSGELFRRTDVRRPIHRRLSRVIDSFMELREGDLVVHVGHGIARYRGLKLLEKNGQVEEHLELEFHGGTKLYVPSTKIGLVQKYIGGTKSRPSLAKLGGRNWERQKERVEAAVSDLAADMLELQAARASRPGIAFPEDTEWQREFDASFPYQETQDQLVTIDAIKRDMTQSRPMDRLLCGDVGYGKTEVAMRAAFKAVDAGFQVAVLVPTTLLCEQHWKTFGQRMAEFPFEIASLSRFATRRQQSDIIGRLAEGSLDIVIGTHRLAQPDVQFHNLGLVIIDEEQRFGVEVKERLKALRRIVDVLTMTATPIPRTLHMGLLGLRDISNLETPPEDRLAVETRVARFEPELIRHAVLRELNRGGQIFFIHNRVEDIETVAKRLRQIVPEARMAVAHGQMHEDDLERVMLGFIGRQFDLLLATTIVESGLDIPNANTIFIDEADRYGLADLHQLRGRVGRYKHRAYCCLLIDPNKNLTPVAAKRLRAIEEFSRLGAGFAIAMRDLEIRGAGNILGAEQSGHIAAVGYELYCDLLEHAVRGLKHLPPKTTVDVDLDLPGQGYIPKDYVPDMRLKIDLYRRLARVAAPAELADFRAELADRFGEPPSLVRHLLELAEIRLAAHHWGVDSVHLEDQQDSRFVVLTYTSRRRIDQLAEKNGGRLRVVDDRSAYLPMGQEVVEPTAILSEVKSLLQHS